MNFMLTALAESAAGAPVGQPDAAQGIISMLVSILPIIVIFYFMLIRPQRKKEKELRKKVEALQVGDEVITIGGIYGKIIAIKDETLTIESASGVDKARLRIARWAIKECLTIKDVL